MLVPVEGLGRGLEGGGEGVQVTVGQASVGEHGGEVVEGGEPGDWAKMSSSSYRGSDGFQFETHWYQNLVNGDRVEFKTKIAP